MQRIVIAAAVLLTVIGHSFLPGAAHADEAVQSIVIHGGHFVPDQLSLPPGKKIKIRIRNQDALPAEFESYDLSREIIVPVNQTVTIFVGPLENGRYEFFMRGLIMVKPVAEGGN